jgi:PIN domain nuclease of toxin-antitoxin system
MGSRDTRGIGSVDFDQPLSEWLLQAAKPGIVRILPFSVEIAFELALLPDKVHRDPADRAIVATARIHRLPPLTREFSPLY